MASGSDNGGAGGKGGDGKGKASKAKGRSPMRASGPGSKAGDFGAPF